MVTRYFFKNYLNTIPTTIAETINATKNATFDLGKK
jgi:hypothetical protein